MLWPYNATTKTYNIPVCWEKFSQSTAAERENVRSAIVNTWQTYSLARFTGWGQCLLSPLFFNGIRITVNNVAGTRAALGTQGNGKVGVMQLNFRLNTPVKASSDPQLITLLARCQRDVRGSTLQTCIQSTAIHEFGHILGMAHEQNRPIQYRPILSPINSCLANDPNPFVLPQGSFTTKGNTLFTDYDPNSMMNYCRNPYFGRRDLSDLDKLAIRVYYGQMPSFDNRTQTLTIPRLERRPDGAILTGSFKLLPDGRFQQIGSLVSTATLSMTKVTLFANGILEIPELKFINLKGHVNQILRAILLKTATAGVYTKSWDRTQPIKFSPVSF